MSRTAHHGTRRERTENHRPADRRFVFVDAAHSYDADASSLSVAERVAVSVVRCNARLARREAA